MNELKEQRFNYAQSNNQKPIKPNKVAIVFSWIGKSLFTFICKLIFFGLLIATLCGALYGLFTWLIPYIN